MGFQGMQQQPVVPNDKRPAKAKRMDDMWMNTLASKNKWSCNEVVHVPKPKVPWTMNKNTQPQKKTEDNKDIKEFEKCHKNLKTQDTTIAKSNSKDAKIEVEKEVKVLKEEPKEVSQVKEKKKQLKLHRKLLKNQLKTPQN